MNRLTLLASGNDPKLAELFAHAESQAPRLRPRGLIGLAARCGECAIARRALTSLELKWLVLMQLSAAFTIIRPWCDPIDLVAATLGALV